MGECFCSVVLDFCGKRAAALGQEGEVVAAAISHIKAEAAKFGLVLVFCSAWIRRITGKCGTLLGPCKTLPMLLILETPHYTFIR